MGLCFVCIAAVVDSVCSLSIRPVSKQAVTHVSSCSSVMLFGKASSQQPVERVTVKICISGLPHQCGAAFTNVSSIAPWTYLSSRVCVKLAAAEDSNSSTCSCAAKSHKNSRK